MKTTIDILISKLQALNISRHVICPSARSIIKDIISRIENPVEILDERSAGYVAVGMCEEVDEPVVIWCSDNDSFRNLTSSLTEAYYRKLPLLVVALSVDSVINQTINPYDTIRYYVNNTKYDEKGLVKDIDTAFSYLNTDIKGPVYLSICSQGLVNLSENNQAIANTEYFDISPIIRLLPANAVVHIGSNIKCNNERVDEIIIRDNHCTRDGNLAMLIGSSVVAKSQLHIGVFSYDEVLYDLNMFGNRHIGNNLIVLSIIGNNQTSTILNFAKKMGWTIEHLGMAELQTKTDVFAIEKTPQYIEVVL